LTGLLTIGKYLQPCVSTSAFQVAELRDSPHQLTLIFNCQICSSFFTVCSSYFVYHSTASGTIKKFISHSTGVVKERIGGDEETNGKHACLHLNHSAFPFAYKQ
jgi:hypothetical protein